MDSIRNSYKDFFTFQDADTIGDTVCVSTFTNGNITTSDLFSSSGSKLNIFILKKGSRWADLLFAGFPGLYLVSERTRSILRDSSGVNFIPVNILDKSLKDIDVNYYRIQIFGKSGPLVKEFCREEIAKRVANGPEYLKKIGLYFAPNSWDGNDFFTPENTLNVFITSKIKALIEDNKLTNIQMEPITEVETF